MKFRANSNEEVSINLTPLIDIVFLLLIFFMITTTFKNENKLKVELPYTQSSDEIINIQSMEIMVDATGTYHVNQNRIPYEQLEKLRPLLAHWQKQAPDFNLLIAGDKMAPHQSVVALLDLAGQLGIEHIQIKTRKS